MSTHRTVFYQDYVTLWNWGSGKKEGLFSKESQSSLHIPSQSTKGSLNPEQQSYSSAHIPVAQGHARARSCQARSRPLPPCRGSARALLPTGNGEGGSGPAAHGGMETLCTGSARDWALCWKLFMPALKSKSGLWRASLTSSAIQLPEGTCVFQATPRTDLQSS